MSDIPDLEAIENLRNLNRRLLKDLKAERERANELAENLQKLTKICIAISGQLMALVHQQHPAVKPTGVMLPREVYQTADIMLNVDERTHENGILITLHPQTAEGRA